MEASIAADCSDDDRHKLYVYVICKPDGAHVQRHLRGCLHLRWPVESTLATEILLEVTGGLLRPS